MNETRMRVTFELVADRQWRSDPSFSVPKDIADLASDLKKNFVRNIGPYFHDVRVVHVEEHPLHKRD